MEIDEEEEEEEEETYIEDIEKIYDYEHRSTDTDLLVTVEKSIPLSAFSKIAMKCILSETIDQFYILRNINSQDNSNFVYVSTDYISIADRYMGTENHAEYRISSRINNDEKLARDIHWIVQILNECNEEIVLTGRFNSLSSAVDAMKRMREDEKKLIEEKEKNDKYIIELRKQCEDELFSNIRVIEETNARIQKLRFEVEDLQVYKTYEFNYFKNWEKARREQNTLSCEKNERYYQKIIDGTKNKIETENRCHMEFENYIEESKNDYLDEIQFWMKHYDEETEKRETEMINLKTNTEKLVEDHFNLKQTFDAHKAEIEDWLEYKRKKKEKEEFEALQVWAATTIQAWWRGVMFRKKLGPYRKKKKGKGKDDKKGKKGKK